MFKDFLTKQREELFPQKHTETIFEDGGFTWNVEVLSYSYPFKHILIENFLPEEAYKALVQEFNSTLAKGFSEKESTEQFYYNKVYDVYTFIPKPTLLLPTGLFYSQSYFSLLRKYIAPALTNNTFFTFHHHNHPTDQGLFIHNDHVLGNFKQEPLPNGINPWYYQTNFKQYSGVVGEQAVMRAAVVLYYFNNDFWSEEFGGETGLYKAKDEKTLVKKITPKNNRLLAFEIHANSWHNYMKCSSPTRNSLTQWFYRQ